MRTLLAALLLLAALVTVSADADPRVISNGSDWSAGVAYSYDGSGNVTQAGTDQYRYDRVGRLVSADVNGFARTYTYDAFGNRLTCTQGASDCQYDVDIDSRTNRASLKNASGVETIQYDARGNLTVLGTHTYTYDAVNMMTRDAGTSGTREFLYTADDERLATVSNATAWTWTVRDTSGKVLREFTSTNGSLPGNANFVWTRDNIYRDGLLLASHQQVGGLPTRYQYHLDHLGTPRKVTDASDNVVGSHDYFAFGPETSGSTEEPNRSRLRYTGHERDTWGAESLDTLDYMHARHYSPVMGRFLSIDPGKDWDPQQPQSWNIYAYVRNNPVNATDPNGREIRYTDAYRALVRSDPVLAQAHRAWYNSPQGRAQHRIMGADTNTVYTIGAGKVTLGPFTNEQRAGGTWPPAGAATTGKANKLDSPEVTIRINVEYLSEPKLDAKAAAETIFHEVTHALDVGSGSKTRDQAIRSEDKLEEQDGTPDPRLEEYRRILDELIPPR